VSAYTRPHRRFNPLTGEWVLVSPQRTQRPWQGRSEEVAGGARPAHDSGCYLCPGNARAGGAANPRYTGTFVFDNDFPALTAADTGAATSSHDGPLLRSEGVSGLCRVVCFSPRHDLTLAEMSPADITTVIDTFADEIAALGRRYVWVQAFENKGELMGCSNPHPHGQIWASDALPNEAVAEDRNQRAYAASHGTPLLVDYARHERERRMRVVHETTGWLAVVPYWAVWPFETLILPLAPVARLPDLTPAARAELGKLLSSLLAAYDRLFDVSFPYSLGWHGAPYGDGDPQSVPEPPRDGLRAAEPRSVHASDTGVREHWQLHAHIYPPLLRSATVKKFMVGYELLAEPQRDLTPEAAAEQLRAHIR
jgi:UDPglucose--hexose-1-phosphate uridylyltransferase